MKEREEVLGKVHVKYRRKAARPEAPEKELHHPLHQPYKRENKGTLRHSLMIDGLGEEDEYISD